MEKFGLKLTIYSIKYRQTIYSTKFSGCPSTVENMLMLGVLGMTFGGRLAPHIMMASQPTPPNVPPLETRSY